MLVFWYREITERWRELILVLTNFVLVYQVRNQKGK